MWFVNLGQSRLRETKGIKLRNPPIRIASAVRRDDRKALVVGRPVVFVDIHVRGRQLPDIPRRNVYDREPLLVNFALDLSSLSRHRLQRTGSAWRIFSKQESH